MNQSFFDNKLSLPLVIQPQQNASLKYLNDWIQENKQQIDANITKYGAVL